jgi:hypothetical protein
MAIEGEFNIGNPVYYLFGLEIVLGKICRIDMDKNGVDYMAEVENKGGSRIWLSKTAWGKTPEEVFVYLTENLINVD